MLKQLSAEENWKEESKEEEQENVQEDSNSKLEEEEQEGDEEQDDAQEDDGEDLEEESDEKDLETDIDEDAQERGSALWKRDRHWKAWGEGVEKSLEKKGRKWQYEIGAKKKMIRARSDWQVGPELPVLWECRNTLSSTRC